MALPLYAMLLLRNRCHRCITGHQESNAKVPIAPSHHAHQLVCTFRNTLTQQSTRHSVVDEKGFGSIGMHAKADGGRLITYTRLMGRELKKKVFGLRNEGRRDPY